jgi:hypothetical protein
MCERCVELDAKIEQYQQMARMISDQRLLDVLAEAIEKADAEALHPAGLGPLIIAATAAPAMPANRLRGPQFRLAEPSLKAHLDEPPAAFVGLAYAGSLRPE